MATIPRVLPAWVSVVSLYLDDFDEASARSIALPASGRMVAPKRQRGFRAGRYCASLALEHLGLAGACPGVNDDCTPVWPRGSIGSITHAPWLVSAAAALRHQCDGLGIDIEAIPPLERAHTLASRTATSPEVFGVMEGASSDYSTAVALIVAAKHSLYKCLHPQVGRSFGYLDASIEDVHRPSGRFRARLKVGLSPTWMGGSIVTGRFDVAGDLVHAGIAIPC